MILNFEITSIEDDVVYCKIEGIDWRNLTDVAFDYMEHPPSMPCRENLCPVESWTEDGTWLLSFHVKDPALIAALRSGTASITPDIDNFSGRISFSVTNSTIEKGVVHQPGACDYCREQAQAGKLPPYHDNCKCTFEKGSVSKMNSELCKLNAELEKIAKSYIQKDAIGIVTKADMAVAVTKACKTPEGAAIARKIMDLERLEVMAPLLKYYMPGGK